MYITACQLSSSCWSVTLSLQFVLYHVCHVLCEFRDEVEEKAEFRARLSWLPDVTREYRVEAEETVEYRARNTR
jgi:hypothetical protein